MSSTIQLILTSNGTAADFKSQCDLSMKGRDAVSNFSSYLAGLVGGNFPGANCEFQVGGAKAVGSLTVSAGGSVAAQACTIGNVTLTGRAANPAANEFVVSATAATQAANMAAAINASASFAGKITATSALGVLTLTAVEPGVDGNTIQLSAGNLANVAVSAAFAGGTDGTSYDIDLR